MIWLLIEMQHGEVFVSAVCCNNKGLSAITLINSRETSYLCVCVCNALYDLEMCVCLCVCMMNKNIPFYITILLNILYCLSLFILNFAENVTKALFSVQVKLDDNSSQYGSIC